MINIFIDDVREPPAELADTDLFACRTSDEGLIRLTYAWINQRRSIDEAFRIDKLYLDHDLGPDDTIAPCVDFVTMLAEYDVGLKINEIFILTRNPVAGEWMTKALGKNYTVNRGLQLD